MTDKEELRQLRAAVKRKCLDCCCQMRSEVKGCRITGCPLWAYREETGLRTAQVTVKGQESIFSWLERGAVKAG